MASPFLLLLNVRGLVGSEWTACLIVWTGQVPTCDNTHVTCATVWHTRSRSVKDGEGGGGEGKWETPKNRRREEGWRDRSSQRQRTKQFTFQAAGEASSQCWLFHWRGVKKTKKNNWNEAIFHSSGSLCLSFGFRVVTVLLFLPVSTKLDWKKKSVCSMYKY